MGISMIFSVQEAEVICPITYILGYHVFNGDGNDIKTICNHLK